MIPCKEGDGELFQIGNTHIIEVRPEEGETMKHISIRVGKILCIYTVGHYKKLDKVVQSIVGMLFVSHHLIDSFSNVNATLFQFHLNKRETIDEYCHIIAIDILADNSCLICHLKNVFCVVGIEEREVHLRPVLTLQHELISKDLCALENRFARG